MGMKTKKRVYAEINKVEDQDDGTIKVFGIASTGSEDSDGETITPDCMRNAIPDYMKFGAVREMHQPSAAGTALSAEVNGAGQTEFSALVVDPVAITKVKTGVYKGFSVGGKVTERDPLNKKIIKGLNLIEVSLVDRPANPDAVINMFKAATTPEDEIEELAELLDSGTVTPGGLLEMVRKAAATPAATSAPTNEPEAKEDPTPAPADTVQKSMWDVGRFAQVLQEFAYLAACSEEEMQWEGDGSAVPEALRQWLAQGVEIFKAMAAEEAEEMVQWLSAMVIKPDVIEAAAKAGLLTGEDVIAKASRQFTKTTKATLKAVHMAMKEASEHLDNLKYEAEQMEEECSAEEEAAKVNKSAVVEPIAGGALDEVINKALAPLRTQLSKLEEENTTLKGQLDTLSKAAAPGKALLRAVAINKAADSAPAATGETKEDVEVPPEGTPERAAYEMRKSLNTGVRLMG